MKALTRRVTALLCTLTLCLTCADALSVEQAIGLLEEHYIDPLPAAAYEADTLDALFSAVGDPYTYYMSAAESERFLDTVEKEALIASLSIERGTACPSMRRHSARMPRSGRSRSGMAASATCSP